jgi:hypothetical protein
MRRAEIINSINELHQAIRLSQIQIAIEHLRTKGDSKSNFQAIPEVLSIFKTYSLLAEKFTTETKELVNIFKLEALDDPNSWAAFLSGDSELLDDTVNNVRFASRYLPKLNALLEQTALNIIKHAANDEKSIFKGMSLFSVTIFEQGSRFSSPERIIQVFESVSLFYESCAMINGFSPSTLSVVSCDSGSDKSFDFLGIAKVIECVVKLIESLWDRVVFYKEHKFEERLDLISKSLPILAQIHSLEAAGEVPPELAEQLRRNVFEGANKFIESGASIPQIESRTHNDPRALMSPVQKLLTSSPTDFKQDEEQLAKSAEVDANDKSNDELNFSELSTEEQQALRQLLNKATGKVKSQLFTEPISLSSEITDKVDTELKDENNNS